MEVAKRVAAVRAEEKQQIDEMMASLRIAGLIAGLQTISNQFKRCHLVCGWKVWAHGGSFSDGSDIILRTLLQHADAHGNRTFASASVWCTPITAGQAGQLGINIEGCTNFSEVWVLPSAQDKGVQWSTLLAVLQAVPYLKQARFLPMAKPPRDAVRAGNTPWRQQKGQIVDTPPPPSPPRPFDRTGYIDEHAFDNGRTNGGIRRISISKRAPTTTNLKSSSPLCCPRSGPHGATGRTTSRRS